MFRALFGFLCHGELGGGRVRYCKIETTELVKNPFYDSRHPAVSDPVILLIYTSTPLIGPSIHSTLVMTVPLWLSCDWTDLCSRQSGAHYSMGPITLPLANVPPQLRSSLHCNLLVGIEPGPSDGA